MYVIRYLLVLLCEFIYSWDKRKHIQSVYCKNGSVKALVMWSHASAVCSATHSITALIVRTGLDG